jgi:exodeoxyribonuclease V alpha subunit
MEIDQIYFKGLLAYLNWYIDIPKSTALDITSDTDMENLQSIFDVDLSFYLTKKLIEKLKTSSVTYPLKPTCFLLGIGFSPKHTELILKSYSFAESLINLVQNNPYELLDIEAITFNKVDKIAMEIFYFDEKFPPRIQSLIAYHLNNLCFKNGHLFILLSDFINSKFEIDTPIDEIKKHLKELILNKKIILEGNKLYPLLHYNAEKDSAEILANLISTGKNPSFFEKTDPDKFIEGYEDIQTQNIANGKWKKLEWGGSKFELSEQQKDAIRKFIENKFMIITGLPGTGKTTVVKALVDISKSRNLNVCLMAPTGIAAKKLAGVCDHEAHTIHKILGYDGLSWSKNEKNTLNYDVIIIDEFSMVDQILMYRFLAALPNKEFKLVFIGDDAQLGSVAPGNVLKECLTNPLINQTRLNKIFRQEEASDIIINSHLINSGKINLVSIKKDFIFVESDDADKSMDLIIQIVDKIKDKSYQILSPTYRGNLGVLNLNHTLQDILNPNYDSIFFKTDKFKFRVDDKVMIIKNDYQNHVYNGEQGILVDIDSKKKNLEIYINGKTIEYSFYDAYSMISMDYARTVHKAQGQEYDFIVLPWVMDFSIQLQRNLLYTAITRAKKKVFIIGEKKALDKSIKNNRISKRNTIFSSRISTILNFVGENHG